jgi:hypothetical protein
MVRLETRRGTIFFPTKEKELYLFPPMILRIFLCKNDPNGEWADESEDGPTDEEMVEAALAFGREALEDGAEELESMTDTPSWRKK